MKYYSYRVRLSRVAHCHHPVPHLAADIVGVGDLLITTSFSLHAPLLITTPRAAPALDNTMSGVVFVTAEEHECVASADSDIGYIKYGGQKTSEYSEYRERKPCHLKSLLCKTGRQEYGDG